MVDVPPRERKAWGEEREKQDQTDPNVFPASWTGCIFPHPKNLTSLSPIPSVSCLELGLAGVQWVRFAWPWLTPASCSFSHSSPWRLHSEPQGGQATGRGVSRQCGKIKMMLFWLSFPPSPLPNLFLRGVEKRHLRDGELVHLAWTGNTALVSRRYQGSNVENKTLRAQSLYVINSEALLLTSTHRTGSGFSFFLSQIWQDFFIFLQGVCVNFCLFSSSSRLVLSYQSQASKSFCKRWVSIVSAAWTTKYRSVCRIVCSAAIERISLSCLKKISNVLIWPLSW